MPASDTTVARPSSYDVASSTSMFRARSSVTSARTLRAAVPVGCRKPAVDDENLAGERACSCPLHHGASVANESPSRMLRVRITTAVRHVPAFRRDPIASQSRSGVAT